MLRGSEIMANNVITIQMNEEQITKVMNFYEPFKVDLENNHIKAFYKNDACAITIYSSLKFVFQCDKAEYESSIWKRIGGV